MKEATAVVRILTRTAMALLFLSGAWASAGAEEETLQTDPLVKVSPSTLAAAKQLQADIGRINSRLTDARTQRLTDVSRTVEKYIPIGSNIENAKALMLALDCKPPLRLRVGESPPPGYRRPSCSGIVTVKPDKEQSAEALVDLPGQFLQGHFLSIRAQTAAGDRRINSVRATIDIRTLGDL
jgi:hypothetical protein